MFEVTRDASQHPDTLTATKDTGGLIAGLVLPKNAVEEPKRALVLERVVPGPNRADHRAVVTADDRLLVGNLGPVAQKHRFEANFPIHVCFAESGGGVEGVGKNLTQTMPRGLSGECDGSDGEDGRIILQQRRIP